jgi:hypothetical protein
MYKRAFGQKDEFLIMFILQKGVTSMSVSMESHSQSL